MEKYISKIVQNLLQVDNVPQSIKNLAYGIEWLIVDKFVENEEYRNILCDVLGERMSLIYEYGERREQKGKDDGIKEGMKELLNDFINSGITLKEISQKTGKSMKELEKILQD